MRFLILLDTFSLIFEQTELIFDIVSKSPNIAYCKKINENLQKILKNFRNDQNYFDKIYNTVRSVAEPSTMSTKCKFDHDGMDDPKMYFKRVFNEIIDTIINQIEIRFKDMFSLDFLDL